MYNTSIKSVFGITNLIYFRGISSDLLYFFRFYFIFLFVKSYVGWEVCALASHLFVSHVLCFQLERGVKSLRIWGGGWGGELKNYFNRVSQEMIPRKKKTKKSETVINTCISVIKQHWKKMAEIPEECDFLTWCIQNFVKKVKQFVGKYYITWLITEWLHHIDITPLAVLFCNCHLFSHCPLDDFLSPAVKRYQF